MQPALKYVSVTRMMAVLRYKMLTEWKLQQGSRLLYGSTYIINFSTYMQQCCVD